MDAAQISQRVEANRQKEFVFIKRRASWQEAKALGARKIEHIYLQPEYRRYYPAGETTAHLVGVTNIDDKGIEGTEYAFNTRLHGRQGSKVVLKDLHGTTIRDLEYVSAPAYGQDLELSIDLRMQFVAYRELKSAVTSHAAKSGSLVMLDVTSTAKCWRWSISLHTTRMTFPGQLARYAQSRPDGRL